MERGHIEVALHTQWLCVMATTVLTITTTGTTNWVCPSGVTSVQVELWGAGGTGGPATGTASGAGGGAGGQYAIKQVAVTPGNTYAVIVPAASTSATTVVNGADATFAATTVVAKGGAGAVAATAATGAGGAGSTTGGVGDTVFAGGNGATGVSSTSSGGGGSGAGSTGTGNNGSAGTGGAAKASNGGAGGNGVTTANTRNAGSNYGGGGSGGLSSSATDRAGGNGAQGLAVLTYTTPLTAALTDDFATQNTAKFAYLTGVAATGGELVFTPASSTQVLLQSVASYDATGSAILIETTAVNSVDLFGFGLQNADDTSDFIEFYCDGTVAGNLVFDEAVNGVTDVTTVGYDATNHRWLRITNTGGNWLWETSPTGRGGSWTTRRTKAKDAGFDITKVQPYVYVDAGVSPGTTKFDNFNLAPPVSRSLLTRRVPIYRASTY